MKFFHFSCVCIFLFSFNSCLNFRKNLLFNDFNSLKDKDVIVFIPGYKGSVLEKKSDGDEVWLSSEEILFGNSTVTLNLDSDLYANRLLKKITIIPFLYEIDVYEECIDSLTAGLNPNEKLVLFPYDWRQNNINTSIKLRDFLDKINYQRPRSISIIAHSMGGLPVAYLIVNNSVNYVQKVIFMATPFRGTMKAFLDMTRPIEPIFLNDKLFTRESFISFGSAYQLFPHPDDKSFYDTEEINKTVIYDVENWKKYQWGPFKDDVKNESSEKDNFIKSNLSNAIKLFNVLGSDRNLCSSVSILNLTGNGLPVLSEASFSEIKKQPLPSNKSRTLLNEEGDILINAKSAALPNSLLQCVNIQHAFPNVIHDRFCNYNEVINRIFRFLHQE